MHELSLAPPTPHTHTRPAASALLRPRCACIHTGVRADAPMRMQVQLTLGRIRQVLEERVEAEIMPQRKREMRAVIDAK